MFRQVKTAWEFAFERSRDKIRQKKLVSLNPRSKKANVDLEIVPFYD